MLTVAAYEKRFVACEIVGVMQNNFRGAPAVLRGKNNRFAVRVGTALYLALLHCGCLFCRQRGYYKPQGACVRTDNVFDEQKYT